MRLRSAVAEVGNAAILETASSLYFRFRLTKSWDQSDGLGKETSS